VKHSLLKGGSVEKVLRQSEPEERLDADRVQAILTAAIMRDDVLR